MLGLGFLESEPETGILVSVCCRVPLAEEKQARQGRGRT